MIKEKIGRGIMMKDYGIITVSTDHVVVDCSATEQSDDAVIAYLKQTWKDNLNRLYGIKSLESSGIKKVIYNDPYTIVLWKDGVKTVVKCQDGDTYNKRIGLAMAICKRYFGNTGAYNKIFNEWCKEGE